MTPPAREPSREDLLAAVREAYLVRDPVPAGLVGRMQAVVAAETDLDLDYELLVLTERSHELVGTRGGTSYTLQFTCGELSLLLRVAGDEEHGDGARVDGWLAPASPMSVVVRLVEGQQVAETRTDARGRFAFTRLRPGLVRLWLTPDDGTKPFGTPAFEI